MSTSTLGLFLRHLALSAEVKRLNTASDHSLLAAYELGNSQAAFTELMRRHGPMVLRTCRRVLGRSDDAEDAFQATFILLARKAGQLSREVKGPLSLGGWLHHVAYQMAGQVVRGAIRRKDHERQATAMTLVCSANVRAASMECTINTAGTSSPIADSSNSNASTNPDRDLGRDAS